jgi:imidazoleglycerol-phosphate dehydratase
MRRASIARSTSETDIRVAIALDGTGARDIATGVGFSTTCSTSWRAIR